ncbi:Piso0_000418 [Millerozyma farinosa CBS 7064]|uniref:Piso0_000418 protein n=1 Tax=Pichia sorbitophila (strain ATCC MYA-4447 / BCRC 22081 / CBS 7064 / NBRC 10061 / NRRL Y-12695) TaxID=559304 RepID=G8YVE0_PICSO|nr:Piso0_000418 [Millerozyma farinosa CBS 7064]CCE73384.1 Piso0_000418 [Millerozyma farinosa CBS 7064]
MYRLTSISKNRGVFNSILNYQRRSISYTLPAIPALDNLKISKGEYKGLLSNKAVNELWFERGGKIVEDLNKLLERKSITAPADLNELITLTFNKPDLQDIYTQASSLHNLQFAFESIRPNEDPEAQASVKVCDVDDLLKAPSIAESFPNEPTDPELIDWITSSFGSISEFRTLLLNSANSIKGDGMVWLVAQAAYSESTLKRNYLGSNNQQEFKYSNLAVMNTYNAGIVDDSLRSGQITKLKQQKEAKIASLRKKIEEKKSSAADGAVSTLEEEGMLSTLESDAANQNDFTLGTLEEAEAATLFSDRKLLPLLAIDASMRNYLIDYGIFGKQQYLENLWNCIDWDVVLQRAPTRFKKSFEMD